MASLSIIIPHYNSTDTLKILLKSIPAKKGIQVIVIDDHSSEEEKKNLIQIKADSPHEDIQFLENDANKKGAGSSRNVGLKKAVGEWVLFADSDDFYTDGFYEAVKKHFNTSVDVVFFKPTSIELDTGNTSNRHKQFAERIDNYLKNPNRLSESMLKYRVVVPWSKLIRRRVIEENGLFFEDVIASNDVMFAANLGVHIRNLEVSDDVIYCVTKSSGSLTTSLNSKTFDTRLDVFIRYYKFLHKKLSKDEFKEIDLNGQGIVYNSTKYGFKKFFNVVRTFKKNKIKVIGVSTLNPGVILSKVELLNSNRTKKSD